MTDRMSRGTDAACAAVGAAALVAALFAPAQALAQDAGEPAAADTSKESFDKGVELYKQKDYAGALAEFLAAYKSKPHYSVLYNIAQCHAMIENNAEALSYYQRYLDEGADYVTEPRRLQVLEEIERLKELLCEVAVEVEPEAASVYLDGKLAGKSPLGASLFVDPGEHSVMAQKDGYIPATKSFVATRDKASALEILLEPSKAGEVGKAGEGDEPGGTVGKGDALLVKADTKPKKVPVGAFAASLGVAVAGAATMIACGALGKQNHDEYTAFMDDVEAGSYTGTDALSKEKGYEDRGRGLNGGFAAGLAIAAAGVVAAAILAPFTKFESEDKAVATSFGPGSISISF